MNMVKNTVFRILLIENSEMVGTRILDLLSTIPSLELLGQSKTLRNGLQVCESTNPDIVMLDINLPDGSGISLIKELKTRWPQICIIMLTNSSNEFYRSKCAELGAAFFLDKTTDFPRIIEIVSKIIS